MSASRRSAAALMALLLAACSSLSERECRTGEWADIGRQDGERGRSAGEFEKHRDACLRHSIKPDEAAYRAAREQGLKNYCTPQGGYVAGRRGDRYDKVCPAAAEEKFLPAFRDGREISFIVRELQELQRRMDDLGTEPMTTGDFSPEARTQRRLELLELRRQYESRQWRVKRMDQQSSKKYGVDPLRDSDYRY